MRILQLTPWLARGGAELQLALLVDELRRRGHEVLIGHYGDVEGHRLPMRHRFDPRRVLDVVRLIRAWRPNVVQLCVAPMDTIGAIAAMLCRVPFVIRESTGPAAYAAYALEPLRRFLARFASRVVVNSQESHAYWTKRRPLLIRNAMRVSDATPPMPHMNGIYVGRLVGMKNIDVLLRACALTNASLYVCGEGEERARLEALAKELRVDARFTGWIDDPSPYFRAVDFAANLSDYEGHPNAVCEAFAAGTPMILSNVAAHRELGGDALFVPLRDVEATAAAIRRTLDDRDAAQERARRARETAKEWSVETMTDAYEAVYDQSTGNRRPATP